LYDSSYGQHNSADNSADNSAIAALIQTYSESVINRDSVTFYSLFNDGPVIWCGAEKDRSSYFFSTYKNFMRGLFSLHSTVVKFDNIRIVTDGAVGAVMMDYSFWDDDKMSNKGSKYLSLLKEHGKWKIISVYYSIEPISLVFLRTNEPEHHLIWNCTSWTADPTEMDGMAVSYF
jgi:hypothetical protein